MLKTDLKHKAEINPRLVAIAGPLQGTVFTLTEPECSIGRDTTWKVIRKVNQIIAHFRGEKDNASIRM